MATIDIDGITIEVQRKKMKNMTLRVCAPQGNVKISAPLRSSDISIRRFAASHIVWIQKHQSALQSAQFQQMYVYSKSEIKQYRQLLSAQLDRLIPYWEQIIGVRTESYQIRLMKACWGTCNPQKRKICLNLELIKYPEICLEYVIVHELVHLLECSHNARFKALMDTFMPGWRTYKAMLNDLKSARVAS